MSTAGGSENSPLLEAAPRFPFLLRGMLSVDPTQANAALAPHHIYIHTHTHSHNLSLS